MSQLPSPTYNEMDFTPDRDRYAEHLAAVVPWTTLTLQKLHRRQYKHGWAGDTRIQLFVCIPYNLVQHHNVRVIYQGRTMTILQGTRPDHTKFKNQHSTELLAYFEWMGT